MAQLTLKYPKGGMASQHQMILHHLRTKGSISALEALSLYRCNRLAARINDLRKSGLDIETDMKTDLTGKRYARYHLAK